MRGLIWIVLACLALAACASSRAAAPAGDAASPLSQATPLTPPDPDRSCQVDADCAVKDVGNCCGYYPACVNVRAETFPEQVKEACAREGRMAVCGYPEIAACQCVEQRCEPARSGGEVM